MKRAIISDVHGNITALRKVLADIAAQGITDIAFLGDAIGYGGAPKECLDALMPCDIKLLGNHDRAGYDRDYAVMMGFNDIALRSRDWTEKQLGAPDLAYLRSLSSIHVDGDVLYCHGSPSEPLDEYIFPESALRDYIMARVFVPVQRVAFCGHTHLPGVFTDWGGSYSFLEQSQLGDRRYELPVGKKSIICVGSVGQPRDRNKDACYLVFDGDGVTFRRVEYDVDEAAALIEKYTTDNPGLDKFSATRLREGR